MAYVDVLIISKEKCTGYIIIKSVSRTHYNRYHFEIKDGYLDANAHGSMNFYMHFVPPKSIKGCIEIMDFFPFSDILYYIPKEFQVQEIELACKLLPEFNNDESEF